MNRGDRAVKQDENNLDRPSYRILHGLQRGTLKLNLNWKRTWRLIQ